MNKLTMPYIPKALPEDRSAAFITTASVHVVNRKSCEELRKMIEKEYKGQPHLLEGIETSELLFRPTFAIKSDRAWSEEEYQQLRIKNMMFRQIGPCQRCKSTLMSLEKNERQKLSEPYMTINKLRKHPTLGGIFGVYYQPDIIQTTDYFEILMPDI